LAIRPASTMSATRWNHRLGADGADLVAQWSPSYPVSPNTNPVSSPSNRISAPVTSRRCPSGSRSLTGWPSPLTAPWIFVLKPPRTFPMLGESCPLLRPPRVGGLVRSSNRAIGLITVRRHRGTRALVPRPRARHQLARLNFTRRRWSSRSSSRWCWASPGTWFCTRR
jgi:hypothetical protein